MLFYPFSQVLMHEFHCHYIKNKYGNNSRLLLTDTDSLMYEIKTEDLYEDFSSNKEMFDFSNYSTKSKYYDDSNKLVIAKMKDKSGVVAVDEFVGLMLKMYSFLAHKNEHKKASQPTIQCRICVASTFIRLSTDFENETKTDVGFSTLYNIRVRC